MSLLWTAEDAARATGGHAPGDWQASGVSIDSRTVAPGELFVALVDARDGHAFVADALAKGAAAAMVARAPTGVDSERLLTVDDTQAGLEALGAAARQRASARVIAVTGSVGKTGTKAAMARGLAALGQTHASARSYNNHWGVPLSLAQLPPTARFGVFELGMNRAGEIAQLTRQVRPDVAIITAIAPAHIEFFENEAGIARAKAEIFEGVPESGTAVVPADSVHTPLLLEAARDGRVGRIITFGKGGDAHAAMTAPDAAGTTVDATILGHRLRYRIGLPGAHWVTNSLAILAAVSAMGLDVDLVAAQFATLRPEAGRGRAHAVPVADGDATLIDDSYNANPTSMRAAFAVLGLAPGRRLAALGAMLELGPASAEMHRELAAPLVAAGVERVFTVGADVLPLRDALPANVRAAHADVASEVVEPVRAELRAGDTLLVKGSLGSGMGRLVHALVEEAA